METDLFVKEYKGRTPAERGIAELEEKFTEARKERGGKERWRDRGQRSKENKVMERNIM